MATIQLEKIWSDWHAEEKPLGKGSYGTVYKAVRHDNNLTSYYDCVDWKEDGKHDLR